MIKLNYLLLLAVAATFTLSAKLTYNDGKQRIVSSQARVKELEAQIRRCEQAADDLKAKLEKAAGNADYSNDIERLNGQRRAEIDKRNQLLDEHSQAQANLSKEIARVGRKYPIVSSPNGYQVITREEGLPKVAAQPAAAYRAAR